MKIAVQIGRFDLTRVADRLRRIRLDRDGLFPANGRQPQSSDGEPDEVRRRRIDTQLERTR